MKQINIGGSGLYGSAVALGCMRMAGLSTDDAARVIETAMDAGVNFFDHADIYGGGKSEEVFAAALHKAGIARESVVLQSKCGIRPGYYDFSRDYILSSVDGILRRLGTDYLDVLLLHRPDALAEPEEVAEAFDRLQTSGKVRRFGVSNHHPMQMELLQKYLSQRLIVNQLQFSPVHTGMVDCGLHVNMKTANSVQHDGMVLDYCRLHGVTIQAWSPFQHGMIEGPFLTNPAFEPVSAAIRALAAQKGVTYSAVVAAWILRHPARMQVVAGSMNPARIADICKGAGLALSREEWYAVYRAAGNQIP